MSSTIHICFHTGKRRFSTIGEALENVRTLRSRFTMWLGQTRKKRGWKKPKQMRVYFCTHCEGFHQTSYTYEQEKEKNTFRQNIHKIAELLQLIRKRYIAGNAEHL